MIRLTSALRRRERGITSIFAVMFAATLLTIIVISFAAIMMRDQARSTDDELSQSAYDAAMAGVEDAKRMVALSFSNNSVASVLDTDSKNCSVIAKASASLDSGAIGIEGEETLVKSTTSGAAGSDLLQAYTCVNISLDSPDVVLNDVRQLRSKIIPLRGVGDFDTVKIEWHMSTGGGISTPCVKSAVTSAYSQLCAQDDWNDTSDSEQPAIIRAQFITPDTGPSGFTLDSLDESDAGNTVFLYPNAYTTPATGPAPFRLEDAPRFVDGSTDGGVNEVKTVQCQASSVLGYHCNASITLPRLVTQNSNLALLRLSTIYKQGDTGVRVSLHNSTTGSQVDFSRVQPIVDSTGRANDLFRRVQARLSLVADVEYPEFALDVSGALCKDFYVTPSGVGQISSTPPCTP